MAAALLLTAGAFELARRQFPELSALSVAARIMNPWWALLAVLAGTTSQLAFSYQQRALLAAFDVDLRRRDAIALTYSGGAISMVAPAGAAVSAAYTFRHYQKRGATAAVATVVTLLSGVISVLSLIILYGVGLLVAVLLPAVKWEPAGTDALIVMAVIAALTVVGWHLRRVGARLLTRWAVTARLVVEIRRATRAARAVRGREWAVVTAYAAGKWALDLACLMAVAATFEADIGWLRLAGVYLTMQVVRQAPLTPGGIGLIEASLLAGLVTAGATTATALVVVLSYRLITFWLTLPAGMAAHLYLGAARPTSQAVG